MYLTIKYTTVSTQTCLGRFAYGYITVWDCLNKRLTEDTALLSFMSKKNKN